MQSKTSFFNKTVIRKDITRFAPVWGAYTLGLLLALVMMVVSGGDHREYWPVSHMTDMPGYMAFVNCGYALLTAQLLFGDMYASRSCYGLHALPLRRETWYGSHLVSGLLFSLVPTALMTLAALPIAASSIFVKGWQIPLAVFAASNLQYILFFGLAVFASFCAGSRIGMIGIYGVLNLGAALAGAAVRNICDAVWLGVEFPMTVFTNFTPVQGFGTRPLFQEENSIYDLLRAIEKGAKDVVMEIHFEHLPQNWRYYGICALVGIGLLAVSLALYRKRQLECAGDFVAFRCLEPVVAVGAAIAAGMVGRLVFTGMTNVDTDYYLALAFGMVVGWFVARMLLERTTRVFRKKSFRDLGILLAAAAIAIGLVYWDPMGVETWVPEPAQIQKATFGRFGSVNSVSIDDQEELGKLLKLHQMAIDQHLEGDYSGGYRQGDWTSDGVAENAHYGVDFSISYEKKNGSIVNRHYVAWADSEEGELVKHFMSSPVIAMRPFYGELYPREERMEPENLKYLYVNGSLVDAKFSTPQEVASLMAAMKADCEADAMAQLDQFHNGYFRWEEQIDPRYQSQGYTPERRNSGISINLDGGPDGSGYFYIDIYTDSTNTLNWLESRGILEDLGMTVVHTDEYFNPNAAGNQKYMGGIG